VRTFAHFLDSRWLPVPPAAPRTHDPATDPLIAANPITVRAVRNRCAVQHRHARRDAAGVDRPVRLLHSPPPARRLRCRWCVPLTSSTANRTAVAFPTHPSHPLTAPSPTWSLPARADTGHGTRGGDVGPDGMAPGANSAMASTQALPGPAPSPHPGRHVGGAACRPVHDARDGMPHAHLRAAGRRGCGHPRRPALRPGQRRAPRPCPLGRSVAPHHASGRVAGASATLGSSGSVVLCTPTGPGRRVDIMGS
jgi:hypothetical protein